MNTAERQYEEAQSFCPAAEQDVGGEYHYHYPRTRDHKMQRGAPVRRVAAPRHNEQAIAGNQSRLPQLTVVFFPCRHYKRASRNGGCSSTNSYQSRSR